MGVGQLDQASIDVDLVIIDVASGALTLLPVQSDEPMLEWPGAWSPDGAQIAFTGARDGDTSFEIFVVPADGGAPVQLTDDPGHELSPSWSPSGDQLAFILRRSLSELDGEIVIIDADGANWTQITSGETGAQSVVWSPAGDRLAFTAGSWDSSGRFLGEIHTIAVDGSDERNLTNHPATDTTSAWSPDGQRIAFVSDRDAGSTLAPLAPDAAVATPVAGTPVP